MIVLIVDDEPVNLDVLEAHLAPLGHHVVRAASGIDALELIDAGGISIVLLDVMMPGLDGIDVLTHLRARPDGLRLPVVLVTALNDRESRLRGLEAGADEFLEKPVDPALLRARVTTLLQLKRVTDELADRNARLEHLQSLQRELTQFIVHDLKNPIGIVHANIDYALDRAPATDGDLVDALRDADVGARRVISLVEDLLLVSQSEAGELPVKRGRLVVGRLLEELRQRHVREAEERGIAIELAHGDPAEVTADGTLLRRTLDNLVDNALRYTPRDGRIQVSAAAGGAAGVEFAVANTGRAVPTADRTRIFEKFARVDGPEGRIERVGPGLGLYFCRRAAEAHGGHIAVDETPSWPTRFVLHLPGAR